MRLFVFILILFLTFVKGELKPGNIAEYDQLVADYVWTRRRGEVAIRHVENDTHYRNIFKYLYIILSNFSHTYKTQYCSKYYLDVLNNLESFNAISHSLRDLDPTTAYLTHFSLLINDKLQLPYILNIINYIVAIIKEQQDGKYPYYIHSTNLSKILTLIDLQQKQYHQRHIKD